jgi:hypothetical protein
MPGLDVMPGGWSTGFRVVEEATCRCWDFERQPEYPGRIVSVLLDD